MMRIMMKSKIHRATVTQADLDYVGSVTLDAALMEAADLLDGEQVAIVDITNGARIETYVIPGPRGSGVIGINGAAAHLVHPGDLVIIMSYAMLDDAEARALKPRVVHVDEQNRIVKLGNDAAEPVPGSDQLRGDLRRRGLAAPQSAAATAAADNRSTCNNRISTGPSRSRLMPLAMPKATLAAEYRPAAVARNAARALSPSPRSASRDRRTKSPGGA